MTTLDESYRFCRDLSRREARNFYPAFRLLPKARMRSMCALYAFLRQTDDIADGPGSAEGRPEALESWRLDLDRALDSGYGPWPGWPALADAVRRHGIPPAYLHEVIDGVAIDLDPRSFDSADDLNDYCHKVASVVGLCCLHIWGFRSEGGRAERLAESAGLALQWTNILRDVREDALGGRTYLPSDDLRRFGVDPADLLAVPTADRVRQLIAFEARRVEGYYAEAARLTPLIRPSGRPIYLAIVGIYRALLAEIVRRNYDVGSGRASVPGWKKLAIVLWSIRGWATPATPSPAQVASNRPEPLAEPARSRA